MRYKRFYVEIGLGYVAGLQVGDFILFSMNLQCPNLSARDARNSKVH
jgi:hypothetical protein